MSDLFERFIEKTDVSGECWLWQASTDGVGYGKMQLHRGKLLGAHQISYLLFKGDLEQGKDVMHSCDNRLCVNPKHLSLGTRQDNIQDMIAKGRRRGIETYFGQTGERNPKSKITNRIADEIRSLYSSGGWSYPKLAKRYDVSIQLIYRVVKKGIYAK
jgi:hypothetical protein